jgi:hypothetical protein
MLGLRTVWGADQMKNRKAFQKNQLIYEFAILIQPLDAIGKSSKTPSVSDYRLAVAKVQAGDSMWRQNVKAFTTFASDIFFNQEFQDISHVPERCWQQIKGIINDESLQNDLPSLQKQVAENVAFMKSSFFELIERIPIQWEPVVFQANTPFTSYMRIKEAIVSVKNRLDYFDRYLKPDFFALFLAPLDRLVSVRLVTTAGNSQYGVSSVDAVSRLASKEFSNFQLLEVSPGELHDRNLRVDTQIFTLGPGIDRAGMALTNFGPTDSSDDAHREFDRIISTGRIVI